MIILISIAAFFSTLLGGLFALHLKDRLHLVLGFSAGAVLGVAFFDLLPEAIELGGKTLGSSAVLTIVAVGFVLYLLLDRVLLFHSHGEAVTHGEEREGEEQTRHIRRGMLGAGSLSVHSFLDGLAIGLAFKVSATVGIVVALAVLTHDFSDGINTVSMIVKNNGNRQRALKWLFVDALAPVVGVAVAYFITVKEQSLGLLLALFSGFFLYIGASDLLPESHHAHPVKWTTFATILGMGTLYLVIKIAGIY